MLHTIRDIFYFVNRYVNAPRIEFVSFDRVVILSNDTNTTYLSKM